MGFAWELQWSYYVYVSPKLTDIQKMEKAKVERQLLPSEICWEISIILIVEIFRHIVIVIWLI